uniref:Uncharacterized protein n=1 Tax=Anguilla anguilla TaxID=7936 RepID=A0A0E9Q7G6_ANGAN
MNERLLKSSLTFSVSFFSVIQHVITSAPQLGQLGNQRKYLQKCHKCLYGRFNGYL